MNAAQAPHPIVIKRLVCLANSRKLQGRCVAGRELLERNPGGWIRPVSARESEEVSPRERQYQDGSEPRLLDIVDVPLLEPRPKSHQQENWLLDPGWYWTRGGTFPHGSLSLLTMAPGPLWINGHRTYNGLNDYVPVEDTGGIYDSLKLIAVQSLQLHVYIPGEAFGDMRRRVQADFSFSGVDYSLWVTDSVIEPEYLAQASGVYNLNASYLTISLGEPHRDGRCYKLVAAIIGSHP